MTYGAENVMQMYIPGLFASAGSGPAVSWADEIHVAGAGQIQYIQKAILDRGKASYFNRIPAQDIIVGGAGTNDNRVTATRDRNGAFIMVYTPTGKGFSIDTKSLKGCDVEASWYDTLAGEYTEIEYAQCDGTGTIRAFTPPKTGHPDWVLVLQVN